MVTRKQLSKMSHEAVTKLHSLITETLSVQTSKSQKFKKIRAQIEASISKDGLSMTDIEDLFVKRRGRPAGKKAAKAPTRSEAMKAAWARRRAEGKTATVNKPIAKRPSKKGPAKKSVGRPTKVAAGGRSEAMRQVWIRRKARLESESTDRP
jgi:hypothetical protein